MNKASGERAYRQQDIERKWKLPKTTMYDQIKAGLFPKPFALSARSKAWDAVLVDACMEYRMHNPNWMEEAR
jgi:predicted DNA-binding transcriptional regulator AlpA